jgi:FixJ family two-component response regulator
MTAPITVHIVEDDPSMRASLARLVGDGGYQLALFASAEDFLAVATPELAGCVLLDLRLPGLSGLELQERLVERGCLLPVVFLTAHGELPAGVRAMKQGAVDFLEKPVPADTLFAAIAAAIARDAVTRRARDDAANLTTRVASLSPR